MLKFILELLLSGLALFFACYIVPGVSVSSFWYAVLAGILIGLANATIGLILRVLTFPLNWLTLGLVSFIITVLMILLVDDMMTSFSTSGFFSAAFLAIITAVSKSILFWAFGIDSGKDRD